jgi:DNA-binding transcriptional regulator YdaS (Cro superfamily)
MNSLDKAIQLAGGLTELANKISANPNQVSNWRARGVPIEKCFAIEKATGGGVTRKDLRPDDWQRIWPELAEAPCEAEKPHHLCPAEEEERREAKGPMGRSPPDPTNLN